MDTKKMISFHGKAEIKKTYVDRVQAHMNADEIIKGKYWERGKGCAVGCTIHGSEHKKYETELGIPIQIAFLEDRIFERLSNGEAKKFPLLFISSIPVGVDLRPVWIKFFIWMLVDSQDGVIKFSKREQTKKAIQDIADLLQKSLNNKISLKEWRPARAYAAYAASAAYAADAASAAAYKSFYQKQADKLIELLKAA